MGTRESIGLKGTKKWSGTRLNPEKATGWDSIPPNAQRWGATELATLLTTLFNSCFRECHRPSDWKKRGFAPVFKNGDPLDEENYRPVTRNKKDELLDKENYRPFSLAPTNSKRLRRLFISRMYSYVPVCIRVLLVCPCGVNTKRGRGGAERDEMSSPSA